MFTMFKLARILFLMAFTACVIAWGHNKFAREEAVMLSGLSETDGPTAARKWLLSTSKPCGLRFELTNSAGDVLGMYSMPMFAEEPARCELTIVLPSASNDKLIVTVNGVAPDYHGSGLFVLTGTRGSSLSIDTTVRDASVAEVGGYIDLAEISDHKDVVNQRLTVRMYVIPFLYLSGTPNAYDPAIITGIGLLAVMVMIEAAAWIVRKRKKSLLASSRGFELV